MFNTELNKHCIFRNMSSEKLFFQCNTKETRLRSQRTILMDAELPFCFPTIHHGNDSPVSKNRFIIKSVTQAYQS